MRGYKLWMYRQNIGLDHLDMQFHATIKTAGSRIISVLSQHTHEGNVTNSRACTAIHHMKDKLSDNAVTTRAVQAIGLSVER